MVQQQINPQNKNSEYPIAVFDSGFGGISVLKELIRLMPHENYLYFGDSKNAPYGTKSTAEVRDLTIHNIDQLIQNGAKAIVIACNTATSAAAVPLRKKYPNIPIIGMEPALKPAALCMSHAQVLVMATELTLREDKFHHLLETFENTATIYLLPAPGIVEFVEQGITEGSALSSYLRELLAPYRKQKVDCIVLGCTHFPFVQNSIQQALGYPVRFFDGGYGAAKETLRRLAEMGLCNTQKKNGSLTFQTSCGSLEKQLLCQQLLNL